jgi:hypothetical protein
LRVDARPISTYDVSEPYMRNIIQNQLRRFGYELRRIEPRQTAPSDVLFVEDIPHSTVTPQATYSPWLTDKDFITAYRAITEPYSHTLVDRYRCYELWQLASRNVVGDVLEIGVWRGGTGCLMAKRLQTIAPYKTTSAIHSLASSGLRPTIPCIATASTPIHRSK